MRQERQRAIENLLAGEAISTQRQLHRKLNERGLAVDQSTLSRDLRELGVTKAGGRYVLPEVDAPTPSEVDYSSAVMGFLPCGPHQIVIRTAIGQAQPVALAIDNKADPSIVATLAGDDTVLLMTRNSKTQTVAMRRLQSWFGDKREP